MNCTSHTSNSDNTYSTTAHERVVIPRVVSRFLVVVICIVPAGLLVLVAFRRIKYAIDATTYRITKSGFVHDRGWMTK